MTSLSNRLMDSLTSSGTFMPGDTESMAYTVMTLITTDKFKDLVSPFQTL